MPKISVLMPVYKTDRAYLKEAIDSILSQTFTDFEFLILDDCPQDRREDVIELYHDSRIKYLKNEENLGISLSRNKLIEMAQGEYLAVMDHDDISLPQRFEKQIAYLDANPKIGICGSGYQRFGCFRKNKKIFYPADDADIRSLLFFKVPIHHPSGMIRTSVIKENHIQYDTAYISINDCQLYLDIAKCAQLHNLPEILCKYRYHSGMTSIQAREKIKKEQKVFRRHILEMLHLNLTEEESEILNNYLLSGRCRIRKAEILNQIEALCQKIIEANEKANIFPVENFNKIMAQYLIKRCMNAFFYGRISSYHLLKETSLPVGKCKIPQLLRLFNYFKSK